MPIFGFSTWQSDQGAEIMEALRTNNSKNIAKYFGPNISLSIKNESGYYSKYQAEVMLGDFFRSAKAIETKLVQRTNRNNNNYYLVYQLKTNKGSYRVFVKFNYVDNQSQLTELRIE